jgi:hypothetical protein
MCAKTFGNVSRFHDLDFSTIGSSDSPLLHDTTPVLASVIRPAF